MLRVLVLSSRWPDAVRPLVGNIMERQTLELAARPGIEVEVVALSAFPSRSRAAAPTWRLGRSGAGPAG
jgi:hypothetical protein